MATLSELQSRLEALHKARDGGALTIEHGDKRITYRSDAELAAAIAGLEKRIERASGQAAPRVIYPRVSKGY